MIDTVRLNIKAGNGGDGCISFLREKFRPKGGPNGGDGGEGGSVYLIGDDSLNTLLHLKFNSTIYADRGIHGKGKTQRGSNGNHTEIRVPLGTVIRKRDSNGSDAVIADITDTNPFLVAIGGKGGWGNTRFATSTNQEPLLSQKGESGESVVLNLELKLLADVGLLAKPNAGKSTLISHCSAARPKIADYPFTTIEPILGVVEVHDKSFVMMEVPGLIEGAHDGVGLGDQFLRHAERARVYIHLLDGLSDDLLSDYLMINEELTQFSPQLVEKPQIVAVNKIDVTEVREQEQNIERLLDQNIAGKPAIFFISAATGEGVEELLSHVLSKLEEMKRIEIEQAEAVLENEPIPLFKSPRRPVKPTTITNQNGTFIVESEHLERLTATADSRDYRVVLQIWREMTRMGLAKRLEEAGIEAGDTIRIGRTEMEWF
tara:strand:- start:269 stop:1561 length:1293 start_codon:yes stop_codon:yes gene_type:complete